jgi:hypothetical protein
MFIQMCPLLRITLLEAIFLIELKNVDKPNFKVFLQLRSKRPCIEFKSPYKKSKTLQKLAFQTLV